tara:strand:+ start:40 stop:330 length:291 start_codon:yes stop_codon:yes gene_type:complete
MKDDSEKKFLQNKLHILEIEQRQIDELVEQYKNIYDKLNTEKIGHGDSSRFQLAAMIQHNHILARRLDHLDDHMVEVNVHLEDIKEKYVNNSYVKP